MNDDMEFVEGTYRVHDGDWQVVIVSKDSIANLEINVSKWESGVEGIVIRLPRSVRLNKRVVEKLMSDWLGVREWREVQGPDSLQIR